MENVLIWWKDGWNTRYVKKEEYLNHLSMFNNGSIRFQIYACQLLEVIIEIYIYLEMYTILKWSPEYIISRLVLYSPSWIHLISSCFFGRDFRWTLRIHHALFSQIIPPIVVILKTDTQHVGWKPDKEQWHDELLWLSAEHDVDEAILPNTAFMQLMLSPNKATCRMGRRDYPPPVIVTFRDRTGASEDHYLAWPAMLCWHRLV